MFDTLLASNAGSMPWTRPALVASIVHAAVILRAVSGTAASPGAVRPAVRDTIRLEIGQPVQAERQRLDHVRPRQSSGDIPAPPPLPDFAPALPPLEAPRTPFSRADWSELTRSLGAGIPGDSSNAASQADEISSMADVDLFPELVENLRPRYPEMLRRAGLSGEVRLEYVIEENGLVDRESVRVTASTHPAFSKAATDAVGLARFKPARRAGRPVAVLVQQTIRFLGRSPGE